VRNSILIELNLEEIRTGTIATLSAVGRGSFSLSISGDVFAVDKGILDDDGWVRSEELEHKHQITIRMTYWVKEKPCISTEPSGPNNCYGPRFYPFQFSSIGGKISLREATTRSMRISIPNRFRAAWHDCQIYGNRNTIAKLAASSGKDTRDYLLSWEQDLTITEISVDMPVRMSGPLLLKYAQYPYFHVFISLVALALAAQTGEQNRAIALYGTLLAAYGFMLNHWGNSEVPQADVLLTFVYIVNAILLLVCAVAWHQFGSWALITFLPFGVIVYLAWTSVNRFRHQGVLPGWIVRFWCMRIAKTRSFQMSLSRVARRHRDND
jgi:hypothetical protein